MSRWSLLLLGSLFAPALSACGASSTPPGGAASEETCPVADPGPPPKCPQGCQWNGTECKKSRGVIIEYAVADGGADGQ